MKRRRSGHSLPVSVLQPLVSPSPVSGSRATESGSAAAAAPAVCPASQIVCAAAAGVVAAVAAAVTSAAASAPPVLVPVVSEAVVFSVSVGSAVP